MASDKKTKEGCGTVKNAGGDKFAYLGHFREGRFAKEGHNQGAPGVYESPLRQQERALSGVAATAPAPYAPPTVAKTAAAQSRPLQPMTPMAPRSGTSTSTLSGSAPSTTRVPRMPGSPAPRTPTQATVPPSMYPTQKASPVAPRKQARAARRNTKLAKKKEQQNG